MSGKPTIAVVDDDAGFRETLGWALEDAGFTVVGLGDGPALLTGLEGGCAFDAVLLDWSMPGMTGIAVLDAMRAKGMLPPTLFLTGLREPVFEERALAAGASDFIEKSRGAAVVVQRVRRAIEQAKRLAAAVPADAPVNGTAGAHAREAEGQVTWRGKPIDLTPSELRVVRALAGRPGTVVSYRAVYDAVKGEGFVAGTGEDGYRANVRALIKRVRRKFEAVDPGFAAIENRVGFGYRWRGDAPE